jgi:hypothetical protein
MKLCVASKIRSSTLWYSEISVRDAKVSEEFSASIFRIKVEGFSFLRNVGTLLENYIPLYPTELYYRHLCEAPKTNVY